MTDENKVIDLNHYRHEKFLEEDFLESLLDMTDEELDDYYDDLAFGQEHYDQEASAEIDELYPVYRALTSGDEEDKANFCYWHEDSQLDYFKNKFALGLFCKQNGLYIQALSHFQELLELDKADQVGAYYEVMAVLILLHRYDEVEAMVADKEVLDEQELVLLFVASLLADDIPSCRTYVSQLLEVNPYFTAFLDEDTFPLPQIMEAVNLEMVSSRSLDSLYFSFSRVLPILLTAYGFVHSYLINHFNEIALEEEVMLEELDFVTDKMRRELSYCGIFRLQDFADWTEEEILAIPGIGKVKLTKLKEAGAIFKK
ncbi:hypothetical protein [Streptococcus loxodontisalivarius]|uniref:Tetratricopeptide (TPR) repeat protein n=1 Tax=Streptococcus loxodontisalivarius TaxID=1349415 RepID=A0ABS2PPR4_9STRE|nr:hypothetical protein [Streptococcus loxodontisalivarius]MBM7642028.1 tetratricopeptide (TPR) repeat protein [Streptococcus loxodontisalivarius]